MSETTIPTLPTFKAGDNITVNYKIIEGAKERIQAFKGDVIKRQGRGYTQTFTVRKMSDGVGVERAASRRFDPGHRLVAVLDDLGGDAGHPHRR